MTLLLTPAALTARAAALVDPTALGGLAASLQLELHAALDVPVPTGKSRLTRHGGRCPRCTVLLAFDPRQPHAHRCPACSAVYTDMVHHEWWLMNAHLWTAEQCTRAATLAALRGDARAAVRADDILGTYADRYLGWPNRDNALGPTRPFFSTYLESIWLLHLAIALDLREHTDATFAARLGGRLRDVLVAPSARLITSFPEGRSNREVWHCAARLAAATLLSDDGMRDEAVDSLHTLLRTAVHTDGSWYEGENYHLFAHRGLLSAVTLAERAGVQLPKDLLQRFALGFAAPFRTMLPDGTFPARRDSQYGISLRQYRTADWLECGIARGETPSLRAALAMMYEPTAPEGDTGRSASTADAERNQPGVRLTRADCSWRALLLAPLELPPLNDATAQSELLEGQGLAVFRRRAGRLWVGLDYGDPGAGHGHPDRLNLVIATDTHRWLDDVGTGSYTAPSLAWYRSSMAHNAPMVNGADQGADAGVLLAHDERDEVGWVSAEFIDPITRTRFVRTVVVLRDHVLDELTWTSPTSVEVELPLQAAVAHDEARGTWRPIPEHPSRSPFLTEVRQRTLEAGEALPLRCVALPSPAMTRVRTADDADSRFDVQIWSQGSAELWSATTIGPPAGAPHGLVSLRQAGTDGRSLRLVSSDGAGLHLAVDAATGAILVLRPDGGTTRHTRSAAGWTVSDGADSVTLRGIRNPSLAEPPAKDPSPPAAAMIVATSAVIHAELGLAHYRGTEESWQDAGEPTAQVWIARVEGGAHLVVTVEARLGRPPSFALACAENPLDNELADVNSDGGQLHWRGADGTWNGVLAVPDGDGVRLNVVSGSTEGLEVAWAPREAGFQLVFRLPWTEADRRFEFDCCVNERPAGRERRRGQLVFSGANGESGYLRGARQGPDRAVSILFQHPSS